MDEDALSSWGFLRGCLSQGTISGVVVASVVVVSVVAVVNFEKIRPLFVIYVE